MKRMLTLASAAALAFAFSAGTAQAEETQTRVIYKRGRTLVYKVKPAPRPYALTGKESAKPSPRIHMRSRTRVFVAR